MHAAAAFGPDDAAQAAVRGDRLTADQAAVLLGHPDLAGLGAVAAEMRRRLHPPDRVTYVVDTNPNYTNVCVAACAFCAFHRPPGHPEAYVRSVEEVIAAIEPAVAAGATTVLLQGGLHPDLPIDYYVSLVRESRRRFPAVTPHFFSAPEIVHVARRSGLGVRRVIERLREAGQVSLPGGGAEVLDVAVRDRLSPRKCGVDEWIDVHREAHRAGMRSTATLMYGHVETDGDVATHLGRIRALQDETGGFTAFIPWSFKPAGSALGRAVRDAAGACRYLRIIAVARLFLDNVAHVQASWFSESPAAGQVALHFGADDFGGTLIDENVHREAGHVIRATREEVERLIREAGFTPARRTTLYEIIDAPAADGGVRGMIAAPATGSGGPMT